MGIRLKLILPLALMFGLFAVVMQLVWAPLQLEQARQDFIRQQMSEISALQESMARYLLSGDLATLHAMMNQQMELRGDRWRDLVIHDDQGLRVYPLQPPQPSAPLNPYAQRIELPILVRDNPVGRMSLVIDWQSRHNTMKKHISRLELFFLLIFATAIAISIIWQNRLIRVPLARLESAAQQLAQLRFDTRLPAIKNDEIGSLTRSFATMRDELQHSRHNLSEALKQSRESEARQRAIFEAMGDGLITFDAKGTITLCNPAALTIFNLTEEMLIGHPVSRIIPALDQAAFGQGSLMQTYAGRQEELGRRGDGSRFPIYINLSEMELSGQTCYGAIVRDISAQKEAEQALIEARQQAEMASKAKSAFLATMSHEIRTPLNGVIGVVQLLEMTPLDQEQKEYVEIIDKSGNTLLSLINDILDISKIESNKMELEAAEFDLEACAYDITRILASRAREQGITLQLYYAADCPCHLVGDAERIRQLLFNLVGNAIKFTEEGGVGIFVNALNQDQQRARIEIVVEDSGIGIAAEDQARLFDAFVQADGSTTRRFGGSGLGLTICKRLVELMAGTIEVDSEAGQGSRFTVTLELPLADKQQTPAAAELKGLRAVIIGADGAPRQWLVQQLSHHGSHTVCLEDVRQLRQALSDSGLQLIILLGSDTGEEASLINAAFNQLSNHGPVPVAYISLVELSGPAGLEQTGIALQRMRLPLQRQTLIDNLTGLLRATPTVNPIPVTPQTEPQLPFNQTGFMGTVLVVDDIGDNRRLIERMLERLGLEVDIARDGQEAIERWQQCNYDLILMDCQMPVMDGCEATAIIKARIEEEQRARTTIIGFTAAVTPEDQKRCRQAGMDGLLLKPIKKQALVETLSQWLPSQPLSA